MSPVSEMSIVEVLALQRILECVRHLIQTSSESQALYQSTWNRLQQRQSELIEGMSDQELMQIELLADAE